MNIRSLHSFEVIGFADLSIKLCLIWPGLKIERVKMNEEIEGEAAVPMEPGRGNSKKKKKGRIHDVRYMDDVTGEVLDDAIAEVLNDVDEDEKIENVVELGSAGKKRKKKEQVLDGSIEKQATKKGDASKPNKSGLSMDGSNEKQLKKKVEAVKRKDGLLSSEKTGNKVVNGTPSSIELKKNKKKSKSGTLESGEKKMKKSKKNRTKPMA